uniref:Uncharacterized protein n=1 Tax=Lepeophtheirus salmonis TaxID=72036 RepID=A0A0K2TCY6_LEPSM
MVFITIISCSSIWRICLFKFIAFVSKCLIRNRFFLLHS